MGTVEAWGCHLEEAGFPNKLFVADCIVEHVKNCPAYQAPEEIEPAAKLQGSIQNAIS